MASKYWVANNPNSEINDTKAQKIAELSATSATLAELNTIAGGAAGAAERDQRCVNATIQDVSTAGQIFVVAPWAGTLLKVYSVLNGVISGGDAVLTVKDNGGSSAGTITIANSGSAVGDLDSLEPSSNNVFTAGQKIEVETDGGSTNAVQVDLTFVYDIT